MHVSKGFVSKNISCTAFERVSVLSFKCTAQPLVLSIFLLAVIVILSTQNAPQHSTPAAAGKQSGTAKLLPNSPPAKHLCFSKYYE